MHIQKDVENKVQKVKTVVKKNDIRGTLMHIQEIAQTKQQEGKLCIHDSRVNMIAELT